MSFKNMGLLPSFFNLIPLFIISAIIWNYYRNRAYSETDKYHTFWPRFWAPTVDILILYPITIIMFYIQLNNIFAIKAFTILSFVQNVFTYIYIIFMHGKYGKTFGKMACKVKVVSYKTEQPISFKQAIIRDIIPIVFLLISTASILFYSNPLQVATLNAHQQTGNTFFHIIHTIAGSMFLLWFLAEIITMLTNSKRRALHDFIAGTVVVRTNIISKEDRTPQSPNSEEQEKVEKSFKEIQTKYIKNCDSADNNEIVGLFFAIMGGFTCCFLLLRLISIGRVALGLLSIVTFFGLPSFYLFINAKRLRKDAKRLELKINALNGENIQFGATGSSSLIIVGFASGIALFLMFVFRFSLFL